jgi:hypothetical protein
MHTANERRLTLRLLAYWEKLRKDRSMPPESDINPDDLEGLWDHCFLVHVRDLGKPGYHYTYLGAAISKAYRGSLDDTDANGLVSPNAAKMQAHYRTVIENRKPLLDEGEFHNLSGQLVKYRQCLLPLGEDGAVAAIFGGMRCKIFPAE